MKHDRNYYRMCSDKELMERATVMNERDDGGELAFVLADRLKRERETWRDENEDD